LLKSLRVSQAELEVCSESGDDPANISRIERRLRAAPEMM
jgi:hypothetical protein